MKLFKYLLTLFILCSLNAGANEVNLVESNYFNYHPIFSMLPNISPDRQKALLLVGNRAKIFTIQDGKEIVSDLLVPEANEYLYCEGFMNNESVIGSLQSKPQKVLIYNFLSKKIVDEIDYATLNDTYTIEIFDELIQCHTSKFDSVRIFDSKSKKFIFTYSIPPENGKPVSIIRCQYCKQNNQLAVVTENWIKIFDIASNKEIKNISIKNNNFIAISPDLSKLLLDNYQNCVLKDLNTNESINIVKSSQLFNFSFSENSKMIAISQSSYCQIYDIYNKKIKKIISTPYTIEMGNNADFTNNDSILLTGNFTIGIYTAIDINTEVPKSTFGILDGDRLHFRYLDRLSDVAVLTFLESTTTNVMDLEQNNLLLNWEERLGKESSMCLYDKDKMYYTYGLDTNIYSISIKARSLKRILSVKNKIYSLAVSPDGKYLAIGHQNGEVSILNIESNLIERTLKSNYIGIESVCPMSNLRFSKDGKYLFGGPDKGIDYTKIKIGNYRNTIWDTETWSESTRLSEDYRSYINRFISNDAQYAINQRVGSIDNLNNSTRIILDSIDGKDFRYCGFYGYSHDDKYIFAISNSKLCAWESATGKLILEHSDVANYQFLAISNVSNTLVLDRADSSIVVLKYSDPAGVFDFYEETQSLKSIAVSSGATIELDADISQYSDLSYSLHNSIGEAIDYTNIIHKSGTSLEFTANNLPAGVYTISLRHGKNTKSIKVLITE